MVKQDKKSWKLFKLALISAFILLIAGVLFVVQENFEEYEDENFILYYPKDWYIIDEFKERFGAKDILLGNDQNSDDSTEVIGYMEEVIDEDEEEEIREEIRGFYSEAKHFQETEIYGREAFEITVDFEEESDDFMTKQIIIFNNDLIHILFYSANIDYYNEDLAKEIFDLFKLK